MAGLRRKKKAGKRDLRTPIVDPHCYYDATNKVNRPYFMVGQNMLNSNISLIFTIIFQFISGSMPEISRVIMLLLISLAFFYFRKAETACVPMEEQQKGKQKYTTISNAKVRGIKIMSSTEINF